MKKLFNEQERSSSSFVIWITEDELKELINEIVEKHWLEHIQPQLDIELQNLWRRFEDFPQPDWKD